MMFTTIAGILETGELAGLGAAFCWVFTSLWFAAAGRRIGPMAVNIIRILLALVFLWCVQRLVFGSWLPEVDRVGIILLGLSGLIGLALGDQLLFTALVDVGPRLATLLMTLAPPTAALLAWPFLDETLGLWAILGITITVAGIAWVVLERPAGAQTESHRHRVRGTIFGLLAGICQAVGLILAKIGIGHTRLDPSEFVDPWSATLVRMGFAAIGICLFAGIMRVFNNQRGTAKAFDISPETEHLRPLDSPIGQSPWPRAMVFVMLGTIFGPVLGVWLSMVAVDKVDAGVAATLMALSPVLILPFAVIIEKERLSWRAIAGALVAVAGVVVLALAPPQVEGEDHLQTDDAMSIQENET